VRRLLLPLILLATSLGAAPAPRAIQRELLKIPTRPGVIQPALLLTESTTPKAVAILFPGGAGKQSLLRRPVEVVLGPRGNFLVRSAEQLLAPELAVLILDCPSDNAEGMNDAFRISDEHAADVRAVLAALRARFQGVKLHLVGTSRGTVSAAYVAQELGPAVDGVVMTSSVFRASGNNLGLSLFRFERLKTPLLLVHHAEDGCPFCPYGQALKLADKLPLITVRGSIEPESGPCDPLANHGFFGREAPVVQAIRNWILGMPYEREIP
jgi:hypothetical protein